MGADDNIDYSYDLDYVPDYEDEAPYATDHSRYLPSIPKGTLSIVTEHGRTMDEFAEYIKQMPREYFAENRFAIHRSKAGEHRINRDDFVKRMVMFLYDFKAHPRLKSFLFYKSHESLDYEQCSEETLYGIVADVWSAVFNNTPVKEITECAKNISMSIRETADVRNGVVKICDNLYYSASAEIKEEPDYTVNGEPSTFAKGKLSRGLSGDNPCFTQLSGPKEAFASDPYIYSVHVARSYNATLDTIKKLSEEKGSDTFEAIYRDLPTDFDFVKLWANPDVEGWKDRYWDIMIAYSTPFFKTLPKKAYLLNGTTRTGKSTFRKVLMFTFGEERTASVQIPQYADFSFNNPLAYCTINCPDEEKGGFIPKEACAIFKTFATKGGAQLSVKNKQPIYADGQFMSFHPTNSNLEWPQNEASPCLKRCMIIQFTNDLSRYDTGNFEFIRDTFLKDHKARLNYANFLGVILALATYFSEGHELFVSYEMEKSNDFVSSDTNSVDMYYRYFGQFFDGVTSEKFLYEDYKYACSHFGWSQQSKAEVRQRFMALLTSSYQLRDTSDGRVKSRRIAKFATPQILSHLYRLPVQDGFKVVHPYGNGESMHDSEQSIVATLVDIEQQRKDKEMESYLDKRQVLGKKALNEMGESKEMYGWTETA